MECFTNEYKILSQKDSTVKYTLIGDLHNWIKSSKVETLIDTINFSDTKVLLIAGDIIEGYNWKKEKYYEFLKSFLQRIDKNKKIVMILGNHDISYQVTKEDLKKYFDLNEKFSNVYPLYNSEVDLSINDDKIHISGLVTDKNDYIPMPTNLRSKLTKNDCRDLNILKSAENFITKEDYINILLAHDPRQFRFSKVYDRFKTYDFVCAAHLHNGYLPNFLTQKYSGCKDLDWNYFAFLGIFKERNYSRGVIYGTSDFYVLCTVTKDYFLVINNNYKEINEQEALNIIYKNKLLPLVITGAIKHQLTNLLSFYKYFILYFIFLQFVFINIFNKFFKNKILFCFISNKLRMPLYSNIKSSTF